MSTADSPLPLPDSPPLDPARTVPLHGRSSDKWDTARDRWGEGVIALDVAEPDLPAPDHVLAALHEQLDHGCPGYTRVDERFAPTVAGWCHRRHGWEVDPEHIVFVPRFIEAVAVVCADILPRGARVLELDPSYAPIDEVVGLAGHELVRIPLDLSGPRAVLDESALREAFAQGADAFLLCSPHNPTGRAWTREEIELIAALCREHDTLLISDEVHADLAPALSHLSTAQVADRQRCIVGMSPAKSFNLAGMEAAALIVPDPELRENIRTGLRRAGLHNPNHLALSGLIAAWGGAEVWLDSLLALTARNRAALAAALAQHCPAARLMQADAGYLAWIDLSDLGPAPRSTAEGVADGWAAHLGREAMLAVSDGSSFGPSHSNWIRLSIATPVPIFDEALSRLTAVLGSAL